MYILFSPSRTFAIPHQQINYQGKLTDTTGAAVPDDTYNMRFYLYDTTGVATTSAVWTETLTGADRVQVTNGLFSVMLGSTTALTSVNFNQTLYLGVEIGGTGGSPTWDGEMSPRTILGTVPAAFEAIRFDGLATSSFLRGDQADTASGLLTFTGGLLSSASSTLSLLAFGTATGTTLALGGDTITDFTGTGLNIRSGVLNVGNLATSSLNTAGTYIDGYILLASTTAAGGYAWEAVSTLGFVDGIGGSNRVAFWSDSDTLTSDSGFTFSSNILTVPAINASNASATSTIAGGLDVGSGDFLYDFSNNNVFVANRLGIGERSPQSPLDITVDADATGGTRLFNFSNNFTGQDVTWNFELDEDKDLTLESTSGSSDLSFSPSTNATDLLYLTAIGQVGIGTTSPSERLTVHDGISLVTEGDPVKVGGVAAATTAYDVAVSGDYAYVVTGSTGDDLEIFDISDPTSPTKVGGSDAADFAQNIAVSGNYAYVVSGATGDDLEIFDVSDPTSPIKVGGAAAAAQANDVVVSGNYAYVVTNSTGDDLEIFDISDPTNPVKVGGASTVEQAYDIAVSGDYAYLTTSEDLEVFDVSNPTNPIRIGSAATADTARGVAVTGNYAYVVTSSIGDDLEIFELSGVRAPTGEIGTLLVDSIDVKQLLQTDSAAIHTGLNVGQNAMIGGVLTITGTASSSLQSGNTNPALIVESRNVGIGTTSPASKLEIYGTGGGVPLFTIDDTSDGKAGMRLRTAGVQKGVFALSGLLEGDTSTDLALFAESGQGLRFYTGGSATERMVMDSSGNVGIGNTSPGVRLWVEGDTDTNTAVVNNIGTAPNYIFDVRDDGTTFFRVSPTGDVCGPDADLSNCVSDEQLKTDVEKLTFTLEEVMQLRAVSFTWNERAHKEFDYDTERENVGFIAQEVAAVIPEWVTEVGAGSEYLKVDEGMLKYALLSAVQELNLNLETIASTTASTTATSTAFAGAFFDNLFLKITEWLADAANGIGDFFAERIQTDELRTDELCVGTMCVDEATFVEMVGQVQEAQSDDAEGGDEPRGGGSTDDGGSDRADGESTDPPTMPPEPDTSSSTATSSDGTSDSAGGTGTDPDDAGDTQSAGGTPTSSPDATDASSTADPDSADVDPSPADDQGDGEPGQNPPLDNSEKEAAEEPAPEPEPEIAA